MYECFHCGCRSVIWDGDFNFEDYCEEGEGIIHECHCTHCGAQITYRIPIEETVEERKCGYCKNGVCQFRDSAEYQCEGCVHYEEEEEE